MYNSLTLVPAYGRDYKSKAAMLKDWEAGKDFLSTSFPTITSTGHTAGYTSIRDLPTFKADKITHLHFRYNRQTQVHVVKL